MLVNSRSEDTLRPGAATSGSRRVGAPGPSKHPILGAHAPTRAELNALERVMYRSQWLLIGDDNKRVVGVRSLDEARAGIAAGTAPTAAGCLANGLLGADIDAEDPLIGDACAEALIAWCVRVGVPYLLRDSGRPGGRHVIAVITNSRVPVDEWRQLCRRLARDYKVVVDDRTGRALRLLTAPHRIGLPSPVLACTITTAVAMDAVHAAGGQRRPTKRRRSSANGKVSLARRSGDRSSSEYGLACALARLDYTRDEAHAELVELGGKTFERTKRWFVRYLWLSALTVVAAERGLTQADAWLLAQRECAAECRRQGITWWRGLWDRAVAEAATDRPRRRRITVAERVDPDLGADVDDLAALRTGLGEAVAAVLADLDPRRRHSAHAALYALAPALAGREGSMSQRDLSVRSKLDHKTVRVVLMLAVERGLLVRVHGYAGGAKDCDSYAPGPAAEHYISAAREGSSPTSCSTPAPTGNCARARLRRTYAADRKRWRLRCDALAALAPGERLATSKHPAAKTLRSMWHQRKWWRELSDAERAERTAARREVLASLHPTEYRAWIGWLRKREEIAAAAVRIDKQPTLADLSVVAAAPTAIHRGLCAPPWRTQPVKPAAGQLELAAA